MRRIILFILILFLQVYASQFNLSDDEKAWLADHPEISIAYDGFFPPYSIEKENGEFEGYAVDVMNLLADRIGIKLKVHHESTWKELYKSAKNKEVDIVATMVDRPERHEWFAFSKPFIFKSLVVVTRNDYYKVHERSDLSGKKVALVKNYQYVEPLLKEFPTVKPLYVDNMLDALLSVSTGKADAAITFAAGGNYFMRKYLISNLKISAVYSRDEYVDAIGIRKDWAPLTSIFNKALNSISEAEYMRLQEKWYATSSAFENGNGEIEFTHEERLWMEQHPVVRLGFTPHLEPTLVVEEDSSISGIAPEIFKEIEKHLPVKIEIVLDKAPTVVRKARAKEIDGLLISAPPTAKANDLVQTIPFHNAYPILYARQDASVEIKSWNDIRDKKIAIHDGVELVESILRPLQDSITIVKMNSTLECLAALLEGKVDYAAIVNIENYIIAKNSLSGLKVAYYDIEHANPLAPAIRKDWPQLVSILNKAIKVVGNDHIQKIVNKWIHTEKPGRIKLSPAEKEWLKNHPVIRVGADDSWAPLEFKNPEGEYNGLAIDYLTKIEEHLGVEFEFVEENWQRLIEMAKNGELDVFTCVAKTEDRDKFLNFTEPYIDMPNGIFARKEVNYISDLGSLSNKKIAVVESYAIQEKLQKAYPNIELYLVKNPLDGIRAVQNGETFGYIDNVVTTRHLINQKGVLGISMVGEIPFANSQRMAVRKDWPELIAIMQKAIDEISAAERNSMYNQWMPLVHEKPFDYSLIWKSILSALAVIILMIIWNRRLAIAVRKRSFELTSKEREYSDLFEKATDAIMVLDHTTKIRSCNQKTAELFGVVAVEGVVGRTPAYFSPEEQPDGANSAHKAQEMIDKALMGAPQSFEWKHQKEDGEVFDADVNLSLFELQEETCVVAFVRSIKEKVQIEQKQLESESKFISVYESSRDAIILMDQNSFIDCNPAALEMFGFEDRESFLKHHPSDLSPNLQPDGFSSLGMSNLLIKEAIEGKSNQFEWTHLKKDGTLFPVEIQIRPSYWNGKKVAQAVIRDTTEIRKAQKSLKESEERYRTYFHKSSLPMLMMKNGKIFDCNSALVRILEYENQDAILNRTPAEISPEFQPGGKSSNTKANEMIQQTIKNGSNCFEWAHQKKNGEQILIEVNLTALPSDEDLILHAIWRDLTDLKKSKEEKVKLESQLRQSQKMQAIGQLAGGIAHDFNNVLGAIIGYTDLIYDEVKNNEELAGYTKNVLRAADRAKNLVSQILTFSRQDSEQQIPIHLRPVVNEVLELLKASLPSTVSLNANVKKDFKPIIADSTKIHETLMNLATNAVHAMDEKGDLTINLREIDTKEDSHGIIGPIVPGEYSVIEVSDTGSGIEDSYIERIFEPFYTTKDVNEGTGLGLSVVYGVMQSHKGNIQIESEVGKGTTFRLFFPKTAGDVEELEDLEQEFPEGKEKILVVDDEDALSEMCGSMLKSIGYSVTHISDSRKAMEIIQNDLEEFDLLLTDQTMPNITGIELAKAAISQKPGFPVLLCTGFSSKINEKAAKEAGCREFLHKPFTKMQLAEAVKSALEH